jgi:hypothetical protein
MTQPIATINNRRGHMAWHGKTQANKRQGMGRAEQGRGRSDAHAGAYAVLPKPRKIQANDGVTGAGLPPRRAEGWLIVEPLGQVVRGVAIATEIEGFLQHLPSSLFRWAPLARGGV